LLDALREGLTRLSERERLVLGLYYYEGLTLAEIGAVLGLTESRVCQIQAAALLRLRTFLVQAGFGH
jgi:RNA polymerase sigma factor for flagellar operon FliA